MANVIYTVVKGDTLSEIAVKYNTTVNALLRLNPNITNRDLIYIGQKIIVSGDPAQATVTKAQKPTITNFGIQSNSENVLFATWAWSKSNVEHYEIQWKYATGDGVAFEGSITTTTSKQSTYSIPANATSVTFRVKPVSQKRKVNGKETSYWTATWSDTERYNIITPPGVPSAPKVTMSDDGKYKLSITLEDLNSEEGETFKIPENRKLSSLVQVQYQIVKEDGSIYRMYTVKPTIEWSNDNGAKWKTSTISKSTVEEGTFITRVKSSYAVTVKPGVGYKVRCCYLKSGDYGEWSEYSDLVYSSPAASSGIYEIYANKYRNESGAEKMEVFVAWYGVNSATAYELQYTTQQRYFDSYSNGLTTIVVGEQSSGGIGSGSLSGSDNSAPTSQIVRELDAGYEYFFRVRSKSSSGKTSAWSPAVSVLLGDRPQPPTTWSSINTAGVGDPITLYWTHNSTDNSKQTYSLLQLVIDGVEQVAIEIPVSDEVSIEGKPNSFFIPANFEYVNADGRTVYGFPEGAYIQWCVATAGLMVETDDEGNPIKDSTGKNRPVYSDWSIERKINIYADPTLELLATNSDNVILSTNNSSSTESIPYETLKTFPIKITATAGPDNQNVLGYTITVTSSETYQTVDNMGNDKLVSEGEEIYSKYFDTTDNPFKMELSAGDLNLENDVTYVIGCTVTMNSGLSTTEYQDFKVTWQDEDFWPDAEIAYDSETYTTSINPYCRDDSGELIEGVTMSVYRREFDGSYTELASGLNNTDGTYITDPHPALDFARYRIVAISDTTGSVAFYDVPGYPTGEEAVIIQWDEEWNDFNVTEEAPSDEHAWSGSLVRLPYNIDVGDDHAVDVELVNYIGRERPVSYYGTQLGHTSTWNVEVPKDDVDTVYALRRLSRWAGDVYVREPSGTGYWATINVSMKQTHLQPTIPVTFRITRVEGDA